MRARRRPDVALSIARAAADFRRQRRPDLADDRSAAPLTTMPAVGMSPRLPGDATEEVVATPAGFEPATTCLEGRCSIQLSYGVGSWANAALSHPARPSAIARCSPPEGLAAHPVIAEIVGVALRLLGLGMRCDDGVVETVLGGVSKGFVEGREAQADLIQGVLGTRPPHQRLGTARGRRLVFEHPFAGLRPPGLHRILGRLDD